MSFFRSMGGTVGVSVLGAVLATRVADLTSQGLAAAGVATSGAASGEVGIGSLNELPAAVGAIVRAAYGDATARIFLIAGLLSVVTFVAILFIKEVPLRTTSAMESAAAERRTGDATQGAAVPAAAPMHPLGGDGAAAGDQLPATARPPLAGTINGRSNGSPDGRHAAPHTTTGPALYGTVHRADHAGIPGAVVTVTDLAGQQAARATTGPDGSYRVTLPASGTFLVVAASGALEPHVALVAVADRPVRHDVVLDGAGGVHGRVHRSGGTGAGVPGATVTVIDVAGNVAGTAVADAAGRYTVSGLPDGTYTLTAAAPGLPPVAVSVVVAGTSVERDVVLPQQASLSGTVVAAGTGAPVDEVLTTLVDATGTVVGSAVTAPDGVFTFADLPEGRYTLTAAGYAPVAQVVQVAAGGTTTAEVRMPAPGSGTDAAAARHAAPEPQGVAAEA